MKAEEIGSSSDRAEGADEMIERENKSYSSILACMGSDSFDKGSQEERKTWVGLKCSPSDQTGGGVLKINGWNGGIEIR